MLIQRILASATALVLVASAGHAQSISDQVVSQLTAQGYSRIEVKTGPSQIKVEAIRNGRQLEVVYDSATGAILKQQVNAVRAGDDTSPGIERDRRDRDFVDAAGNIHSDDDDDGNRGLGIGRDDDDDHGRNHGGRGRGSDDDNDDDDDHGGNRGNDRSSSDDNDDSSGRGRGRGRGRGGDDSSDDD